MRFLYLLLLATAATESKSFTARLTSTGSALARAIESDNLEEYWNTRSAVASRRSSVLKSASQNLNDYYDEFYLINVTLGTPPQSFALLLDTFYSLLWVPDSTCPHAQCFGTGRVKPTFSKANSTTFKDLKETFVTGFQSGNLTGIIGQDVLYFSNFYVTNQGFGLANYVDPSYGRHPYDGVFGLGWPSQDVVSDINPPLQIILPQMDQPLFTLWFDRKVKFATGNSAGVITFGAVDTTNCDSTVNYVPLLYGPNFWMFPVTAFSIGTYFETKNYVALSDTASAYIGAPRTAFNAIVKQTQAVYNSKYSIYNVPCSQMSTLPNVTLTINRQVYTIPSIEYVIDVNLGNGQCVLTFFPTDNDPQGNAIWVLGATWIRSYCNIYDIGRQQIGFARSHPTFG